MDSFVTIRQHSKTSSQFCILDYHYIQLRDKKFHKAKPSELDVVLHWVVDIIRSYLIYWRCTSGKYILVVPNWKNYKYKPMII